jgi:hypothetical protein
VNWDILNACRTGSGGQQLRLAQWPPEWGKDLPLR